MTIVTPLSASAKAAKLSAKEAKSLRFDMKIHEAHKKGDPTIVFLAKMYPPDPGNSLTLGSRIAAAAIRGEVNAVVAMMTY